MPIHRTLSPWLVDCDCFHRCPAGDQQLSILTLDSTLSSLQYLNSCRQIKKSIRNCCDAPFFQHLNCNLKVNFGMFLNKSYSMRVVEIIHQLQVFERSFSVSVLITGCLFEATNAKVDVVYAQKVFNVVQSRLTGKLVT